MFDHAWKFTVRWEGSEFTDDPDDPGGATRWGVDLRMLKGMTTPMDQAALEMLGIRQPVTRSTIVNLTERQAKGVYKHQVWDRLGCALFQLPVAVFLFDSGVLHGSSAATKFIQRAHNTLRPDNPLKVDGRLGPMTRQAIMSDDPRKLAVAALDKRYQWYREHVKVAPSHKKFLRGWQNRCNDLRAYLNL